MKKFLAIFAAVAVIAAAGFAVIRSKTSDAGGEAETTSVAAETSEYYGDDGDYTDVSVTEKTDETTSESTESRTDVSVTEKKDDTGSFKSQIDAVTGSMLIVVPDKNSAEYKSSDKFAFSISGIKIIDKNGKTVREDDVKNFSSAEVTYSGGIKETYPAQVDAQKVVLSEREYCNVYFVVNGTIVRTLRVPVGEDINSSDMPNAGAYCRDGEHFKCWLDGTKSVSSVPSIQDSIVLTAEISKD